MGDLVGDHHLFGWLRIGQKKSIKTKKKPVAGCCPGSRGLAGKLADWRLRCGPLLQLPMLVMCRR